MPIDPDYALRLVAIGRVNELSRDYGDIVPIGALSRRSRVGRAWASRQRVP